MRGGVSRAVARVSIAAGVLAFAAVSALTVQARAQSGGQASAPAGKHAGQTAQAAQGSKPPSGGTTEPAPGNGNPFPENEDSAPLLPSGSGPNLSADLSGESRAAAPTVDKDPVRSPDDEAADSGNSSQGFSSSQSGLANITAPPPNENSRKHGKHEDDSLTQPFPQASSKEDLSVGNYYMDTKDWRGALSRFESALVLAPDNPDVYWGLAECERHLGRYAAARGNYLKVMEYDPGSHHAREARKALRDPEIANARPSRPPAK